MPNQTIIESVRRQIGAVRSKLPKAEAAVLRLLEENWNDGNRVSQREIVATEEWLGCHPKHESEVVAHEYESTTRMVRQIIRNLRVEWAIPVLSDRDGYFLPLEEADAKKYLAELHRTAKARAAASMVTYHKMCEAFGFQGELLEVSETARDEDLLRRVGFMESTIPFAISFANRQGMTVAQALRLALSRYQVTVENPPRLRMLKDCSVADASGDQCAADGLRAELKAMGPAPL
jgi:hypothetical protein